jgi:hypothetical protein
MKIHTKQSSQKAKKGVSKNSSHIVKNVSNPEVFIGDDRRNSTAHSDTVIGT